MSPNLSPSLVALVKNANQTNFDDCSIDVTNNAKGEGFIGDVVFILLTNKISQERQSLVVKQQKLHDGKTTEWSNFPFENEIYFYDTLWPTVRKMYEEITGKSLEFIPRCLSTSRESPKMLALEDLNAANFNTHDKTKSFDQDQMRKIFETYGTFHGISMSFKEQNCEEFSRLVKDIHHIWKDMFTDEDIVGKGLVNTVHETQNFFDSVTEKHLIDKLVAFERDGKKLVHDVLNRDLVPRVITHGDCWSNNFLFRYDENHQLQDIKLIDFQLIYAGSPLHDLTYCFYSGGSREEFDKLDYYLNIYHSRLTETLQKFGLDSNVIFSFSTLRKEWKKYSIFGFAMGLLLWKTKLANPKTIVDFLDIKDIDNIKEPKLADGKEGEHRQRVRDLVIHMYNNDFF